MFTGVSGLLANAEGINVIGNNLANVNTIGFKDSRILFSDMLSASIGNGSQIGRGTQIQKVDDLFSQGSFETTAIVSDLAIQGDSFFVLGSLPTTDSAAFTAPTDATGVNLSRAGAFRLIADTVTADTYILVNPDGYPLLDDATGAILTVTPATAGLSVKISKIGTDGTITAVDSTGVAAVVSGSGKIGTLAVMDKTKLSKIGGTLYKADARAWQTVPTTYVTGATEKIYSNSLEQSTVDMAGQFVKMILTQRAYSANSKTITTADEMTQEVLNLKR
jgi:flagellar hook protein FlgE